ncbi:MAG TPA: GMC family oxidoreductase N-terminal domain-containing protein [Actinophytocola sp.]|uniref:GMC family oxidoreductase n=1 Tax=Actinophytocola sp. TaxID=1872138 RepID=UPI002DBE89A4|nr:GMC family oxidoreductase N-terminal domain-containing protein [Actinophytocola sp.]HEU5475567.1 GMC family oxidoreductase N-terminal domain-containing protein [Actinophytocola sp.]
MYDYVIVGAGSAGCVLAARLSEDPDVTVCLLEAGPADTSDNIHIPAAFAKLFRSQVDWDYDTHDEPACDGRRIYLPRGRVLGGSSSMNAMVYTRGNRLDYDEWNVPGWRYDELLPYFKRAEDNERGASEFHGTGGPLAVSDGRSNNPMSGAFVEAAVQAGYQSNDDFNGAHQDGFGFYQVTMKDGRRCSTATGYLHPATARPNLTVVTNVLAHKVVIENGRATAVAAERFGEVTEFRAAREVILAAGAYNSPQLLMLSGVGPAQLLGALGIDVVLDAPMVGQNLQDHPQVPLVFTHDEPISLLVGGEPHNVQQYMTSGTGPLASNGPEAGGFVRSTSDLAAPDLQYHAAPVMFADGGLGFPTAHAISYAGCVLRPASRGMVMIASADPTTRPQIRHNFYTEDSDMELQITGLRIGLEIARQNALRPYTGTLANAPASDSDADLRAYIRRWTQTEYQPSGTCAIGSVVDADLNVLGIEGLRVVDASVLPTLVRGNMNAPTIAVAEKAADVIRGVAALPSAAAA